MSRRLQLAARSSALALALLIIVLALWVRLDRPGLRADYHALDTRFQGETVVSRVEKNVGLDPRTAGLALRKTDFFSVRWSGWLLVEQAGSYRFLGQPRKSVYILIDGEAAFGDRELSGRATGGPRMRLEKGIHAVEIGYSHLFEPIDVRVTWSPPAARRRGASDFENLPPRLLFAREPGALGLALRSALADFSDLRRKALAQALFLAGLVLLWLSRGLLAGARERTGARLTALASRRPGWLYPVCLVALFAGSMTAIFPFTTGLMGWDDTYYMLAARDSFGVGWILNRYAHVYLLKLFTWLGNGGLFLGSRLLWSFVFATIVTAFAVAARAAAPRQPLTTFALAVLLLFSQPLFFLRIGTAVPDYPTAMFVTVAVALYLTRACGRAPPVFEWQAFCIGAATIAAFKSKELGIILLWLPLLFLFERGKLDPRRFARKILAWTAGAAAAYLCLMALDGWILGDAFFSLHGAALRNVIGYNLGRTLEAQNLGDTWTWVIWEGHTILGADDSRLKYMALAVVLVAGVAVARRKALEIRLLHLLPLVYLLMLMVIRFRATYALMERYLYPVMPVAALLVALGVSYLRFDRLRWRDLTSPLFFLPAGALAFVLLDIAVPYQSDRLAAAELLPAGVLDNLPFSSADLFLHYNVTPGLIVVVLCLLVVFYRHLVVRLVLVAASLVFVFGMPLGRTLVELRDHWAIQRSDHIVYPLRVFGDSMEVDNGTTLLISDEVRKELGMLRQETFRRIVSFYFQRGVRTNGRTPFKEHDYVIITTSGLEELRRLDPDLAATAQRDPSGVLALLRPRRFYEPSP